MPVNEYHCQDCQESFERARRFNKPHPSVCPKCAGALRQVYHPFIFRMRKARSYSPETSARQERHMAAQIGEDELVRGKNDSSV